MDLNNQNILCEGQNNNIGELEEDRISELPDSLLHKILSPFDTKLVAQTSVLSKRWNHIWKSIPNLHFEFSWDRRKPYSLSSQIDKYMNFVDTTLHHHRLTNIQKLAIDSTWHMDPSQVDSWISSIGECDVEELSLYLNLDKPFFLPLFLFPCESLTKLKLYANKPIHFPKTFSFPKLKSLQLFSFDFADDICWNEQHFPVLEKLILDLCTWFCVKKFCILAPSLKVLKILNSQGEGLEGCDLKISAPDLVSIIFDSCTVAKDYDLSSFSTLYDAKVDFNMVDLKRHDRIGLSTAVTKFLRAISHVQSLKIDAGKLEVYEDIITNLPVFHNLNKLYLLNNLCTDKLLFALLKAAPNLKCLDLESGEGQQWEDLENYDGNIVHYETDTLFRHLQSVRLQEFAGSPRELRWAKMFLMNTKSLQTMTIQFEYGTSYEIDKETIWELSSLPRSSEICVLKVYEYGEVGRCVFEG